MERSCPGPPAGRAAEPGAEGHAGGAAELLSPPGVGRREAVCTLKSPVGLGPGAQVTGLWAWWHMCSRHPCYSAAEWAQESSMTQDTDGARGL